LLSRSRTQGWGHNIAAASTAERRLGNTEKAYWRGWKRTLKLQQSQFTKGHCIPFSPFMFYVKVVLGRRAIEEETRLTPYSEDITRLRKLTR
jgi:hypothetical protein